MREKAGLGSRIAAKSCESYTSSELARSDVGDNETLVFQLGEELVDSVLRPHLLHHVEEPEQLLDSDRNAVGAKFLQDLRVLLGAARLWKENSSSH